MIDLSVCYVLVLSMLLWVLAEHFIYTRNAFMNIAYGLGSLLFSNAIITALRVID